MGHWVLYHSPAVETNQLTDSPGDFLQKASTAIETNILSWPLFRSFLLKAVWMWRTGPPTWCGFSNFYTTFKISFFPFLKRKSWPGRAMSPHTWTTTSWRSNRKTDAIYWHGKWTATRAWQCQWQADYFLDGLIKMSRAPIQLWENSRRINDKNVKERHTAVHMNNWTTR